MDEKKVATPPQGEDAKPTSELEEVKLYLDKLNKDVIVVKKQFISIQRSLDAIYEDRDLLADLGNGIDKIRSLVIEFDKHNQKAVDGVKETVEKKAEEMKMEVSINADDVKSNIIKDVVKGISKSFQKEKAILKQKSFFRKIFEKLTFKNKKTKV